jgi:predicted tellurium resistance membrane protein TerC
VALVLGFIGGKMIAEYFGYIIPTSIALGVVGTLLSAGVGLSVLERRSDNEKKAALVEDSLEP